MPSLTKFSYSSIEKYLKCSWFWKMYYDETIPRPDTDTVATVAGSICHEVLETFYGPQIDRSVSTAELLDMIWMIKLDEQALSPLFNELTEITAGLDSLKLRSRPEYKGPDAIRDSDGKPYKAPSRSSAWKNAASDLGLSKLIAQVDRSATTLAGGVWANVSLSNVFLETCGFLQNYSDTLAPLNLTVRALELQLPNRTGNIVENVVWFDTGVRKIMVNAVIDMLATDSDGRIYMIDHKTSKTPPSPVQTEHWEQLLLYAWAHHQLWGVYPNFVGINHIRTNTLVLAPFNPSLVEGMLSRHTQTIDAIEKDVFVQQSPTSYGNSCYSEYSKTSCPYLSTCHPVFCASVSLQ